jgi:antitoxin (DNA-binding transcriptional repressor) of toxin-antitoxin stability system
MKRVGVAELKDQLSRHLRSVEAGTEIEVTARDRAIARIVPVPGAAEIKVRPPRRPFSALRRRSYQQARWARSSTDLLLDERRDR